MNLINGHQTHTFLVMHLARSLITRATGNLMRNDDVVLTERSISQRICGTKNPNHRNAASRRQMHGSSVSSHKQPGTPCQRNELRDGCGEGGWRILLTMADNLLNQVFFSGSPR